MIKVLHLLRSNRFSGAENVACQIIEMFKNGPIDMAYSSQDGKIRETLREREISFKPMKSLCFSEVRRVVREFKPDIIHTHDVSAGVFAAMAGGKARIISHIHMDNSMRKIRIKSLVYGICSVRFKHIFWVSTFSFRRFVFKKAVEKKSTVLRNVINAEDIFDRVKSDNYDYDIDIIYVGRLTYLKNPQRLIKILKIVVDKYKSLKAVIVGNGELENEVKELVEQLGIGKSIKFTGFCANPLKMIKQAKVMLMTSRFEGLPMCALEALALGVPIVSTPAGGLAEIISDEENGFLSEDDTTLADCLVNILRDDTLRKKLSESAKRGFFAVNDLTTYKLELLKQYCYDNSKL